LGPGHEAALAGRELARCLAEAEEGRPDPTLSEGSQQPRSREDLGLISWTHEALTGVRIEIPEGPGGDDGTA